MQVIDGEPVAVKVRKGIPALDLVVFFVKETIEADLKIHHMPGLAL